MESTIKKFSKDSDCRLVDHKQIKQRETVCPRLQEIKNKTVANADYHYKFKKSGSLMQRRLTLRPYNEIDKVQEWYNNAKYVIAQR